MKSDVERVCNDPNCENGAEHHCAWRATCEVVETQARALANVLEASADAVVASDLNRTVTAWNVGAQRLFGYGFEEIVGQPEDILWVDGAMVGDAFRRVVESAEPVVNVETRCRHASGRLIDVLATRTAVKDRGGRVVGACLYIKDIMAYRRMRRIAQQAEKMSAVGKMAAALAHEIRNPLNSMNLHIVLMERALAKFAAMDGAFKESINVMREEVTRLELLVREFLEYARPVELHFEPSDVGALVDEVISLGIPASDAKVHVERYVEPESMAVVLDRNRMKQALINLVRNAVEAMPGGGVVGVSAVRKDGELLVEVKDSGVGISEDARAHIFDLFFTTKESGTGLGLPIVMQLVELHGGTIEVESEETVGTTVRVRLPAV